MGLQIGLAISLWDEIIRFMGGIRCTIHDLLSQSAFHVNDRRYAWSFSQQDHIDFMDSPMLEMLHGRHHSPGWLTHANATGQQY